jgi:tetratricopeptide (TPR) repeat protein
MAVVYRAREIEPLDRIVALKVIRSHATEVQRQRFERECAPLARFSHPNVAAIYESGVSESGEPWAAMELVDGLPISDWCDEHRSSVDERVGLVLQACQGLAHAHSKAILHRDIKPSNQLVTDVDGKPVTKVIDFGIAGALEHQGDDRARLTGRHLIGTPAYMSPESVHVADRESLDARNDVYSLGIVLYELLCGRRPYDLEHQALADWVKTLATREPPTMTRVLSGLTAQEQFEIATVREATPGALRRRLGVELDAIVAKALSLDPERRYRSSSELADDLQRHLDGQPVSAHPPSRIYLTRKFVRRHWVGVLASIAVVLALISGIVGREIEMRKTRAALEESNAVTDFMVDLLEHASPQRMTGDEVTLQDIIDRGAEELQIQFPDQPATRARLLHTLGRVFGARGDYERDSALLSQARDIYASEAVDDPVAEAGLLADLAVAQRRLGRLDEAEQTLMVAREVAVPVAAANPLLEANLASSLGNVYVIRENWEKAEPLYSRALELREANLPPGDPQVTTSRNNLATTLTNSWQPVRALPLAEQTLVEWRESLPAGHPWIGIALNNLAVNFNRLGRRQEALDVFEQALQEVEHRLGPGHPDVADYWRNISVQLNGHGRRDEGRAAMQKHHEILLNSLGPEAERTLAAERRLIALGLTDRQWAQTLAGMEDLRERLLRGQGNSSLLEQVDINRAQALVGLGRYAEAQVVLDDLLERIASSGNPNATRQISARRIQAMAVGRAGDPQTAVEMLEQLLMESRERLAPWNQQVGLVMSELAAQALAAGDLQASIRWALEILGDERIGVLPTERLLIRARLAAAYRANGQAALADETLKQAVEGLTDLVGPDHPMVAEAQEIGTTLQ